MKRQRGAAVIVAMLVVALATIAAGSFMFRTHVQGRKLENAANASQARWLLRAAEQWGAAVLHDDARQNSVDHLGETWGKEMPPLMAEGFQLSGHIVDLDGRFDLNGLVSGGKIDETRLAIFRRLLLNLKLPLALADAIADWLDADDEALSEAGAEGAYYQRQASPVAVANRLLVSLDELLPVRGMTPERLERLRPYVAVLPRPGPVNVNTAPAEVLAALSATMSLDEAYALAAKRDHAYFRNAGDLRNALDNKPLIDERLVAFASRHFMINAYIAQERVALHSQALFERSGSSFPTLVWRTVR